MDFDLARPDNPSSILCGRRAVLSRLRQLETITLNQQTPAYFHHTKEPCAHSAYYLPTARCAFVCVVEMPQQFSPSLPDLSPHFQTFFSPFLYFSVFLFLLRFPLTAARVQTELQKEVRLQHVPDLPMDYLSSLSVFHYVSVALFVSPSANRTQLPTQARFYAGYELQGRS